MSSLMKNSLFLVLGISILGMIGAGIYTCFPQYYFPLYTAIPLYFILIGVLTIPILNKAMQMGHKKFQMAFMLSKAIKLFITILLCVLYVVFIKENMVSFLLALSLFYVAYTILEVIISININKELKK